MTQKHKWQIISGICKCGHSWEDHHLGVIMNRPTDLPEDHPPYLPQECEFFGFNEMGGLDAEGKPHCDQYVDKDSTL